MKRRKFIDTSIKTGIGVGMLPFLACRKKDAAEELLIKEDIPAKVAEKVSYMLSGFYNLSLSQWSLRRMYEQGRLNPLNFATQGKTMGFAGLVYSSSVYKKELSRYTQSSTGIQKIGQRLKATAESNAMKNLIFKIDNEGDLASQLAALRTQAISNHHKWIDLAASLGCDSVQINDLGSLTSSEPTNSLKASLSSLSSYAAENNLDLLVSNSEGQGADPSWLLKLIDDVNASNFGLLPNFSKWCLKKAANQGCAEEVENKYDALKKIMPHAKGILASTRSFDSVGDEENIDFYRMMTVVKNSGFKGYVTSEFDGEEEEQIGIKKTRDLLINCSNNI